MKARLETIASIILLLMVVLLVIWWFIALARAMPWIDEIQFLILYPGLKLTRIDADDIQEKT